MMLKENRLLERKLERKVLKMSILKQLKKNALNNLRERPLSFAIGLIAVIYGMVGFVYLYFVCV